MPGAECLMQIFQLLVSEVAAFLSQPLQPGPCMRKAHIGGIHWGQPPEGQWLTRCKGSPCSFAHPRLTPTRPLVATLDLEEGELDADFCYLGMNSLRNEEKE